MNFRIAKPVMFIAGAAVFAAVAPAVRAASPGAVVSSAAWVALQGPKSPLESSSKDKALVVLWATWCQECREELRSVLPELAAKSGVEVMTLNTDSDAERVREFVRKEGISLPVYQDPKHEVMERLKVEGVPHWAVLKKAPGGAGWQVAESQEGFRAEEVQKALRK